MPNRIGIFGGTFDPPHLGHIILANEAFDQLKLNRLLWVLTPVPPHKLDQPITPLEHRLAMTQLALDDYPQFELSRVEIDRPDPHFMVDTVKLVQASAPSADLVLLIGGDSLKNLPDWHQPAELVAAVQSLGVMKRPGESVNLGMLETVVPGIARKVVYVDAPLLEISSHDIRRRAGEGRPFRHYLPPQVYDYIVKNGLYHLPA
jgi:nicotinate-nucleotide adenylyltransferase